MTGWIGCFGPKWVRADIVLAVYVDGLEVKLRTAGVFAWDPIYKRCDSTEEARLVAETLVADLGEGPQ